MNHWKMLAAAMAAVVLAAGSTVAQDPPKKKPQGKGRAGLFGPEMLKRMDANNDGKVSKDEFKDALAKRPQGKLADNPAAIDKLFDRIDADSDGFITAEEAKKAAETMKGKLKDKKKPAEKKPDGV